MHVDVRRHRAEPRDESEIEDGRHVAGKCTACPAFVRVASAASRGYGHRMESVVAGFWGAFFGTAGLMVAGAAAAFALSLRRVALMAAGASLLFVAFVV